MPDGSHNAHTPMSAEALDEAERRALIAAVAESLADPRPDIPHEEVRAEMLRDLAELRQRMEALPQV
jgi:hypothetical protein